VSHPADAIDVSIIVVNWHSQALLAKCLQSLSPDLAALRCEVIVIDSASFDGCDAMLRQTMPAATFIQSQTNLGFARANNIAARRARGTCLMFLNPDTELDTPTVRPLYDFIMANCEAGVVGCRLLNSDGSLQASSTLPIPSILLSLLDSDLLRRLWPSAKLWGTEALYGDHTRPREATAVSGACLMIRRELFERAGGFSEDYFMYLEDVDLADTVRRLGCRNYHLPSARVVHHGGSSAGHATTAFAAVMMPEATRRFLNKKRGPTYARLYTLSVGLAGAVRVVVLGAARPVWGLTASGFNPRASFGKWLAVLKWSLGYDDVAARYYPQR